MLIDEAIIAQQLRASNMTLKLRETKCFSERYRNKIRENTNEFQEEINNRFQAFRNQENGTEIMNSKFTTAIKQTAAITEKTKKRNKKENIKRQHELK